MRRRARGTGRHAHHGRLRWEGPLRLVTKPTSRMLDWRYVVPLDRPTLGRVLLIGAPGRVATELEQASLATEVMRDECPPESADVAAIFRGSRVPIGRVAEMLRPGGGLYWEVSRSDRSHLRL